MNNRLIPGLAIATALVIPFSSALAADPFITSAERVQNVEVGSSSSFSIRRGYSGYTTWTIEGGEVAGVTLTPLVWGGIQTQSQVMVNLAPTQETNNQPVRIKAVTEGGYENTYEFVLNAYNPRLTISPGNIAQARVGIAYYQPLSLGGSITLSSAQQWAVTEGSLPAGIALNPQTGAVVGTPTIAGTFNFTVSARETSNLNRAANPKSYSLIVQPASTQPTQPTTPTYSPVAITTRGNPVNGQVNQTYSAQIFRASGGSGRFTWAVTSGRLPNGLWLDSNTGIIQGTPTEAGTFNATLKVADASLAGTNTTDTLAIQLVVAGTSNPSQPTNPTQPSQPTNPGQLANPIIELDMSAQISATTWTNVANDAASFSVALDASSQDWLSRFIEQGTTAETRALGSGERRALVRDALDTMARVPTLVDLELLASGQIPQTRNITREREQLTQARATFRAIYGRDPNFQNNEENLAWNTLMYRIRFPRNLTSEQYGITQFRRLFGRSPSTPFNWATVRVLGYVHAR